MSFQLLSRIVSDFETQLSGAIAIGATSFIIQSVVDLDGTTLSDGIYCFTIDRDSTGAKEYLVGQLTNATKTISAISSVGRQGALTTNAQRSHRIGANVIISDHSALNAIVKILNGTGTIDPASPIAYATQPTLSSAEQLATKGYVDGVVTGGTINADKLILGTQTAGETVAAGNIVYFKSSDSRWWLADADLTATFQNVQLGVALGVGTAGNAITGGVQISGICTAFTGLTATAIYYLSNTAGAVATSAGTNTVFLGQAVSTTGIILSFRYSVLSSTTVAGESEEATVAEITAGTGAGATGARLFINPTSTVSVSAGAGDVGKVPRLNAAGLMDKTFNESFTTCVTRPVSLETAIPNAGAITQNNALFGAHLVYIPAQITISQATFDVTAVGGNFTMYLALYSYDGQTRILNSSLAITASGRRTLTFGAVTIPAGFYYEGIILGGSGVATQTYWRWNVGDTTTFIMNATSGKNPYFGTFAVTANTLPVTFTPSTLSTASAVGHPLFRYD